MTGRQGVERLLQQPEVDGFPWGAQLVTGREGVERLLQQPGVERFPWRLARKGLSTPCDSLELTGRISQH